MTNLSNETLALNGNMVRETAKAICIEIDLDENGGARQWFPKSIASYDAANRMVTFPVWFARKERGLVTAIEWQTGINLDFLGGRYCPL
jgi:hypothetical protein